MEFGADSIRSGHLLLAALSDIKIRKQLLEISPQFNQIDPERLHAEFAASVKGSSGGEIQSAAHSVHADAQSALTGRAIEKYTVDMTAQAKAGQFDAISGRDSEISQLIDVLMRRRQNNPVLTGEAGVGKTAVAEGLAQRITSGAVPDGLKGVRLLSLDLGLLQAGASMKGEFEQRLRDVVEQVQGSLTPIILFIDELHTLVGAGGQAGTGDAANLLKPALGRRFQVVKVEEPALPEAVNMLRSVVPSLEAHHGVLIRQSAVVAAVKLSARYLPARHLPDKAVSLSKLRSVLHRSEPQGSFGWR